MYEWNLLDCCGGSDHGQTTGNAYGAVICDGKPQCLHAVRSQIRLNATCIKIHASGGVLSELDNPHHQQVSSYIKNKHKIIIFG